MAQALIFLQNYQAHGQDPQEAGDDDLVARQVADPGEDHGHSQDQEGGPGLGDLGFFQYQVNQIARREPQENARTHRQGQVFQGP